MTKFRNLAVFLWIGSFPIRLTTEQKVLLHSGKACVEWHGQAWNKRCISKIWDLYKPEKTFPSAAGCLPCAQFWCLIEDDNAGVYRPPQGGATSWIKLRALPTFTQLAPLDQVRIPAGIHKWSFQECSWQMPFDPHRLMSEVHSLLSVRSRGRKERVGLPQSSLCVV